MQRIGPALLIALSLPLQSCASQDTTAPPTALPADAIAVTFDRFETLGSPLVGGPQDALRSVVRDQEAWESFWLSLTVAVARLPRHPPSTFPGTWFSWQVWVVVPPGDM